MVGLLEVVVRRIGRSYLIFTEHQNLLLVHLPRALVMQRGDKLGQRRLAADLFLTGSLYRGEIEILLKLPIFQ